MFLTPNVLAQFKKATLKLVKGDGGETTRAAEAALVFDPFTAELAREMGEDLADHLFTADNQIRAELSAVTLRPRVGALRITARPAQDMDGTEIEPVGLSTVTATVKEDERSGHCSLVLTATLVFSLESKVARDFVLDSFGRSLLWTFEPLQRDLLADAAITESLATLAGAGGPGSSVTFGLAGEPGVTLTHADADRLKEKARRTRHAVSARH